MEDQKSPLLTRAFLGQGHDSQSLMIVVALKKANEEKPRRGKSRVDLTTKSVQSAALALQSVDDVHGGDRLALGVLGVGDGVTDHVLKEGLEDTAGLLVDETRDTLDTTTTSEATDGGLGDTLDVVSQDLAMALRASLSETLASLSASRHDCVYRKTSRTHALRHPGGVLYTPFSEADLGGHGDLRALKKFDTTRWPARSLVRKDHC